MSCTVQVRTVSVLILLTIFEERQVGDDTTNQQPSFVGSFVENVFFYMNRVGFLSEDNVILSLTCGT